MDALERVLVPEATAAALNYTAYDLREENRPHMQAVFDRPTRYTLNSLNVTPADEGHLTARLWFKDSAGSTQHYLLPQVEGGGRGHKRFERLLIQAGIMRGNEYAVPGKRAPLDAYGNIRGSLITSILSQLGAMHDVYQRETARSRKRAGPARTRYFVPGPGSWDRLPRGIWTKPTSASGPMPIIMFVRKPTYQVRYRFHEFNTARAEAMFPERFDRALAAAVGRSFRG